jgi:hypothetical protein
MNFVSPIMLLLSCPNKDIQDINSNGQGISNADYFWLGAIDASSHHQHP